MFKKIKSYTKIFWELLKTDLLIIKKGYLDNIINMIIWIGSTAIVFSFIFPKLGMPSNYGLFMIIGSIASWSIFESFTVLMQYLTDFEGNNTISYQFTLPIPNWLIFIKKTIAHAIKTMSITIFALPLGKLILWNQFDLQHFSITKFIFIFIALNIFTCLFGIFLATIIPSIEKSENAWMRGIFPLWFMGGAQFPWQAIHKFSPTLGYITLVNPFLYCIEGIRSSVLGAQGYIPYWICLIVVIIAGFLLGYISISKIKKQIDLI